MAKKKLSLAYRRLLEIRQQRHEMNLAYGREARLRRDANDMQDLLREMLVQFGLRAPNGGVSGRTMLTGHEERVVRPFVSLDEACDWILHNIDNKIP